MNQYESEMMAELLKENGYQPSLSYEDTDVCVINSCTVTATGDSKCRKYINRVRRENPDCIIVLTGCMPQAFSANTELFSGCDIVLGNTSRREIITALNVFLSNHQQLIRITPHETGERFEEMRISGFGSRTRAYIKIEDGCNRFCTYCIIPYARGRVRSKPIDILKKEAVDLAAHGFKELVLVGINLSAYGQDIGCDIVDAVQAVCGINGVERVRLGSIEPERMTGDVLKALSREPKFCPQFHLSLQSGCDDTLKRMRRHYTTAEYREIVDNIRKYFENPAVTTDIMVGFVNESEEEFRDSLSFCEEIGFAKAHVFPYSRRKGTKADLMEGQLSENVKNQRAKLMIERMLVKQRAFMDSQVGKTAAVLFEVRDKDRCFEGYTENYTRVKVETDDDLSGRILTVKITKSFNDYCVGELLDSTSSVTER